MHFATQAKAAGDACRRRPMIAGNHLDGDASRLTNTDRLACLGPGRVDDADQTDQGEIMRPDHQIARRIEVLDGNTAPGQRQNAHRVVGKDGILCFKIGARRCIKRALIAGAQITAGPRQQNIRRAFDPDLHPLAFAMKGRHELVG